MRPLIPVTIPHHFDFGDAHETVGDKLDTPTAWDALRTTTIGPFAIPTSSSSLAAVADAHPEIGLRAHAVAADLGAGHVASYGAGIGVFEHWLQRHLPGLNLMVTEHGAETVQRLTHILPNANVVSHNLLADPALSAETHIFHRIDAMFTRAEFRRIVRGFSSSRIILISSGVAGWRSILRERRYARLMTHPTHSGWIRNRAAIENLWGATHRADRRQFFDLPGWVLTPKS